MAATVLPQRVWRVASHESHKERPQTILMQTLILTDEEANSFRRWRQHQENFEILEKSGVFGISNGSAELHFNSEGKLSTINTHLAVFRRINIAVIHKDLQKGIDSLKVKPTL